MTSERPFSLTTHGAGSLSLSRWKGEVLLNTFGALAVEPLLVMLHGLELGRVDDWRWRLAGEADARRVMLRLVEGWPGVARFEVSLGRDALPGVCLFRFDVKGADEVYVAPELEYHRDEQRALVPAAEVWLQQVLEASVAAKPVWTAEWCVTRAEMLTLLAGPMDPFV
ncbi:MAG: hypothetical protein GQE15_16435 [Archangiaceae bacterium]|nr:hypothetical protein [Archangiaceae bacterium]